MRAELIENRIIVWNIEDSRKLFSHGYYGKPIGIPKPKPEEINVPLILDLIEGLYLLENKKITIYKLNQKIAVEEMTELCKKPLGWPFKAHAPLRPICPADVFPASMVVACSVRP